MDGDIYFGLAESYQIRYPVREIRLFRRQYPGLRCHAVTWNR